MKSKLSSLEKKWVLYDVGNSAFVLLAATLLPIYFDSLCSAQGLSSNAYLASWSFATSIATLITALLGPIIGTMADYPGNKKRLFLATALIGSLLLLFFWVPSGSTAFLVMYVLCKISFSLSLVIYDSMLVDVSSPEDMDAVSSQGYAWGYIGSIIPFVVSLVFVLMPSIFGMSTSQAMILCFIINALWWIACSLPLARAFKQKYSTPKENHIVQETFGRLWKTLKNMKQQKKVFVFLLAFFFYIDGVYTIIDLATAYGKSLGLSTTGLLLALLFTQFVAFPASLIFARLSKSVQAPVLIKSGIIAYFFISVYAMFLNNIVQFWILAFAVGCFQGGIQAISRSYFAKIIPENSSGEYFGIFDICGKGASFLGTTLVGGLTAATGSQALAIGSLSVMFVLGFLLLNKAEKLN
jgi:UMF1 family MFS transporter